MVDENFMTVIKEFRQFFSEFEFEGIESGRFYNTLIWCIREEGLNGAYEYVVSYFKLINNPNANEVKEKMQSKEFVALVSKANKILPHKHINNRLEIYFGNPGVGKTNTVIENNPEAEVMVCNSNFEPNDLLETFDVDTAKEELKANGITIEKAEDMSVYRSSSINELIYAFLNLNGGKPKYKPTALMNAIREGKPVILDEIGKLTRQCQDFLVGFTDNKKSFEFKGEKINIAEGFKIIGTMNLEINGNIYALQSPLVDRAAKLVEVHPNIELLTKISLYEEGE